MYISNVAFAELGLPMNLPKKPLSDISWKVSRRSEIRGRSGVVLFVSAGLRPVERSGEVRSRGGNTAFPHHEEGR